MVDILPKEKHDHHTLIFPDGFLWGAATSAHQVEGDNINSDWWDWELKHQPPEKRSGKACDQYHKYEEDFDLAKKLFQNAHRLSIEWARIEPKEGEFNQEEIEHYKKVLQSLKHRGFTVMLTLWHFSLPKWVMDKGGWENGATTGYFAKFVERILPEVKDYVDLWVTINEPGVYTLMGYIKGGWPPQKKNLFAAAIVQWNLSQAHKRVYKIIHKLIPEAKVGIAQNAASFQAYHKDSLRELLAVWILDIVHNQLFYKFSSIKSHDFLGINYYFNDYISFNGERSRLPSIVDITNTQKEISDLGWEIYPQGMFDVLMDYSNYHLPIYITENGLASTNDDRRCRFLIAYLQEIYHAIEAGAEVKGYFHWSLIDNFEWADGFAPRFGLIEINYENLERKARPSAYVYADIIKHNGIPHLLLRFIGHTVKANEVLEMDHSCPDELCRYNPKNMIPWDQETFFSASSANP